MVGVFIKKVGVFMEVVGEDMMPLVHNITLSYLKLFYTTDCPHANTTKPSRQVYSTL